jgi:hypothetical protein
MSSNIAILSGTITLVTLVFAIFGASWLNQRSIERLLEQMVKRFDARFDSIGAEFKALINQRVDGIEQRLDQRIDFLDQRMDRIERQLDALFRPGFPPRA